MQSILNKKTDNFLTTLCKLRQLASWSQLDRPHVVACLRSLALKETELLPSLNRVCTGTKFYSGNSVNCRFTILPVNAVPSRIRLSDVQSPVSKK